MKNAAMPKSKARNAHTLLGEVRRLILDEPRRYNQRVWRVTGKGANFPPCGTIACVAGWVQQLKGSPEPFRSPEDEAREVLGLTMRQSVKLFSGFAVDGASQSLEHAVNGARHINAFRRKYAARLRRKKV